MTADKTLSTFLITGANGGLGKEAARQLALRPETTKVWLACRNDTKALQAKAELEAATGKQVFEIVLLDTSSQGSATKAVEAITEPIDGRPV